MLKSDRRFVTVLFWLVAVFALFVLIKAPSIKSAGFVVMVIACGLMLYKNHMASSHKVVESQKTEERRAQITPKDWFFIGLWTFLPPYLLTIFSSREDHFLPIAIGLCGLFFSIVSIAMRRYGRYAEDFESEDARRTYDAKPSENSGQKE